MEIKGKDRYRVTALESLNNETMVSLSVLYLPFIGSNALALYHVLSSEANRRSSECTVNRLCKLLDCTIRDISKSIKLLEQFKLMRTYINEQDGSCRFELLTPLTPNKFMKHEIFSRLYLKKVGNDEFEITRQLHVNQAATEGKELEITSSFDLSMFNDNWNMDDEYNFDRYKKETIPEVKPAFSTTRFLRGYSTLVMPTELRTKENLEIISQIASLYSIDEETMRIYVGDAIDIDTGKFDIEALKKRCLQSKKVSLVQGINQYDVPPVQFLYELQGRLPVSSADKKTLEYLQVDLKMPREVVNVLVEYTFNHNDRAIPRAYIEKIATSWAVKQIDTIEKAQNQLKPRIRKSISKVPDFTNKNRDVQTANISYDEVMTELFDKE